MTRGWGFFFRRRGIDGGLSVRYIKIVKMVYSFVLGWDNFIIVERHFVKFEVSGSLKKTVAIRLYLVFSLINKIFMSELKMG